ncbi:MAG: hypothetical protein HUU20_17435 [Pirellulales bacterium]|nr:hypothetical protein [Pirellulales bacterium]
MHNIDFLPAEYRQRHARRRRQSLRNSALGLVVLLVAAAAFYQQLAHRRLERELAAVTPQYERVTKQTAELGRLQAELAAARLDAELFTYLRHPWPRTQILAALLSALPAEIGFTKLEIRREAQAVRPLAEVPTLNGPVPPGDASASQAPASADLSRLRAEFDHAQTAVSLEGLTTDSAALHQYFGALNRSGFFTQAELDSLEADRLGEQTALRFQATLVVCPGYGLPGGPSGPPKPSVAALQK